MKLPKRHVLFLISGFILAVAYPLLSQTECIQYTQSTGFGFNPKEDLPYVSYLSLSFQDALVLCGLEILLLPARYKPLRILAIPVAVLKVLFPFASIWALNLISSAISGGGGHYAFFGGVPYLITALAVLSLIQMILMVFLLPKTAQ